MHTLFILKANLVDAKALATVFLPCPFLPPQAKKKKIVLFLCRYTYTCLNLFTDMGYCI